MEESDPLTKSRRGSRVKHGLFLIAEKLLRWCVHPGMRSACLRLLGARVGRGVRVAEVQFFNLQDGFRNLQLADGVYIGPGCLLDLAAPIRLGARSTLSPGVAIITHADPGAKQGSRLTALYPPKFLAVVIGDDVWLGAGVRVLAGVRIGSHSVIGAGSVVTRDIDANSMAAGVPAAPVRRIESAP